MRLPEIHCCLLRQIMVAVVFLLGFHGIGHSMNLWNQHEMADSLSHRDSLIIEMVEFIHPNYKLDKHNRKHIESRMKRFPHKIIRRDTVSHFLNTAYSIAYYEFVKHDFKRSKKLSEEFAESSMPPEFFAYFFNYSSIGLNASNSLNKKGKLKTKKDKNSWYTPIKFEWSDSLKWDFKRSYVDFLDSFLDDVPMDCATMTYRKLLTAYHNGGGKLEFLNGYTRRGFIQRCVDANRQDILMIIFSLWEVSLYDFNRNQKGYLEYKNPTIKVDSAAVAKTLSQILSFDVDVNKRQIDSLIAIGSEIDLTPRIMQLSSLYFNQYRYLELVNACERLQNRVSGKSLNTLHNYWALGLSNLGRYEEALIHYDKAIALSTDSRTVSTMKMNKASTLGEMGRLEESVALFIGEKDLQTTPFEKFVWNDNLGYSYSFADPVTALYYYSVAEKHLDSGTIDLARKIRHFCRKAQVLDHNKFLQRNAIEKAIDYSRKYGCSEVAKGMAYAEMATFASSSFDYIEADRLFKDVFKFYRSLENTDLRMIYLNRHYASNLSRLGRFEEATRILTEQLALIDSTYGDNHPEYLLTLCALVQLSGNYTNEEIDSAFQKLQTRKRRGIVENQKFEILKAQVTYLEHNGDYTGAMERLHKVFTDSLNPMQRIFVLTSLETNMRKVLELPDYEKKLTTMIPSIKSSLIGGLLTLTDDEGKAFQKTLTGIINGAIEKHAYECALELSLFRKGLLFTKKKVIEKKLGIKRPIKKAYKKLQSAREELNHAIAYNDSVHIPELAASAFQLEREIGHRLANDRKLYLEIDRKLSQITGRLSANDLAVEFIKYSMNEADEYGAFLINQKGLIGFISIGSEEDILINPNIVWSMIGDNLHQYENLYFCPDGILNRLSIEYLDIKCHQPLNQSIRIHRVFHLSEVEKKMPELGQNVALVGISDHNSPVSEGTAINRGNWTDLPNVEYELQLVENNLKASNPIIFLNDDATEPNLTTLLKKPISILHISTHGFYRSNEALVAAAENPSDEDYHIARRFLSGGLSEISGLVLRQGNISWKSPYILEDNDDLLTAEEIEQMNCPNLTLTVLSACETGLGEIDADGVWGLQRAFRISGTKNLICSLNKVDDYWTAQFMDAFYEQAASGNNIYDSFHTAQRWLRRELPDNPEIWSSFILIE